MSRCVTMVQAIDMLLFEWNDVYGYLEHAEALYEANGCTKRPKHRRHFGLWGAPTLQPT